VDKGWELNGYLIVVALALAVTGPGALSLDAALGIGALVGTSLDGALGAAAVGLGVGGGWVRWATRRPPQPQAAPQG